MSWFREQGRKGAFANNFERILIILIDARFDQQTTAEKALENTKQVFKAGVLKKQLERSEIPLLVPRRRMTAEKWTNLFHSATSRLRRLAAKIGERKEWDAEELLSCMSSTYYKVPYLGVKTSRLAVRWLHELVSDLKIDMSSFEIPIDILVYRVASRLGLIDPHNDKYYGKGSPADLKIQSFAKVLFPDNPWFLDEPLWSSGRQPSKGGHCFPRFPDHKGCIFEEICPRKYVDFDPAETGIESNLKTGSKSTTHYRRKCRTNETHKLSRVPIKAHKDLPTIYICRKCGRKHSKQEFKESRFCRNCGTWLSRSSLGVDVHMKLLESQAELEELHDLGRGFIYNDYSGLGSYGKDFNVLHEADCVWVPKSKASIRKYFFNDIDRAIEWLEKNRGKEGKNWKRCGTCKPGIYSHKR